jgi:ribosomal protein S7
MIVRILGEGQFTIPESELDALNDLDAALQQAVEAADEQRFTAALAALLDRARAAGQRLPDEVLASSELVLPAADSSLDEVRGLLGDEGLIPG